MAILTKDKFRKRVIDLNGPEGNAFCLLGTAMSLCKQIGISVERKCIIVMIRSTSHLITFSWI